MADKQDIALAEKFVAAQGWWRDAGVDYEFADEIIPLLGGEEPDAPTPLVKPAEEEAAPAAPRLSPKDMPDDLAAFRQWWTSTENPFLPASSRPVAPRGEAGAPLMIIVPMPEADDTDLLLGGIQGRMIANILRAIGIDPEAAYWASALPAHMPLPDFEAMEREGLGLAVKQHIALARPERVMIFGSKLPALLGNDAAAPPESVSAIGNVPTFTTFAPDRLLDHARQRARLWKRLLEWTRPA